MVEFPKGAVRFLVKQTDRRGLVEAAGPAVADLQDIEAAIVVVVKERHAACRDFRRGKGPVGPVWRFGRQALRLGHVFEEHHRLAATASRSGFFWRDASATSDD